MSMDGASVAMGGAFVAMDGASVAMDGATIAIDVPFVGTDSAGPARNGWAVPVERQEAELPAAGWP